MTIQVNFKQIERLAPMPASVARLAKLVFDPATEVAEMARVISLDPVLAANVLRWANSSWSAAEVPILDIRDAVVRLGMAQLLKLAIGNRLSGPMQKPFPGYDMAEQELWRHSLTAGLAAEKLSQFTTIPLHRAAFTAALLHDIGKILLEQYLTAELIGEMQIIIDLERKTYVEAESAVLGINHAEAGARIAQSWKFPEELIQAIEKHHQPSPDPDLLVTVVQVGNAVAKLTGTGLGREQMNLQTDLEAPARLGLSAKDLEDLCALVISERNQSEAMWSTSPT